MTDIACLIPVRNASRDLQICLDSLLPLNPVVLALDDGSTDDTRDILLSHPLVRRVLEHPRRESYAGWDDWLNRNELLKAAEDFKPRWIFWIDADEALPAEDARHLLDFLQTEAVPKAAYGVNIYRMIGDMAHFDKAPLCVYRIFGFAAGQELPMRRLHFPPIPLSIHWKRWIETRFRLMHRASLTEEDRQARYHKYELTDPERKWQESYEKLLDPPAAVRPFPSLDLTQDLIVNRARFEKLRRQTLTA